MLALCEEVSTCQPIVYALTIYVSVPYKICLKCLQRVTPFELRIFCYIHLLYMNKHILVHTCLVVCLNVCAIYSYSKNENINYFHVQYNTQIHSQHIDKNSMDSLSIKKKLTSVPTTYICCLQKSILHLCLPHTCDPLFMSTLTNFHFPMFGID